MIKIEKEYARAAHGQPANEHPDESRHAHAEKPHKHEEAHEETLNNDNLDGYRKAGKILGEVLAATEEFIKPGMKLLDIANMIENMTREKGAEPAFPANLSLNSIAAHYTPAWDDETTLADNHVLKVDIGAHIDGYVADAARTFCFNNDCLKLSEASKRALDEAIKLCRPGTNISEISTAIEDTITGFGYKPIQNLTGHGVGQYIVHMEPTIPNMRHKAGKKLEENMIIAIEPFATDGAGMVKDILPVQIYRVYGGAAVRSPEARKIIELAIGEWTGLPFAERWISNAAPDMTRFKIRLGLKELRDRGMLHEYAPLKDIDNGMVSQWEHTVIVKDEPEVTTKF